MGQVTAVVPTFLGSHGTRVGPGVPEGGGEVLLHGAGGAFVQDARGGRHLNKDSLPAKGRLGLQAIETGVAVLHRPGLLDAPNPLRTALERPHEAGDLVRRDPVARACRHLRRADACCRR